MRYLSKLLVAGGLVLVTGPFCFMAPAQDGYVDLEAEAAAREAAGKAAPEDPYGARPTRAYPATSYGLEPRPGLAPRHRRRAGIARGRPRHRRRRWPEQPFSAGAAVAGGSQAPQW
ncbi:MAG: hypothetical protein U5K56_12880 [Halioglobus sp.]|nr:hypothetical protein [Halioglobus sp.]